MDMIANKRFLFVSSAILIVALSRLLPHPPNFTPVAAMALFGGAYFSKRAMAFLIPLLAMVASDIVIMKWIYPQHASLTAYFSAGTTLAIYLCFALIVMIGFLLRKNRKALPVLGATAGSSVLFFLVTNFAVWLGSPVFPQDISGLVACYAAAIPFFNNGILGDFFFSGVLFGGFHLARVRFPELFSVKA